MTKKEKEELERKQRKKNKTKNIIIFILVIALIVLLAVFLFKQGIITLGEKETTNPNSSNSADIINDNSANNSGIYIDGNTTDNKESTSDDEKEEPSSEEKNTKESENKVNSGDKIYAASLPLTVDDTIAILHSRYGKDYRINRSTAGEGYTNFAVFKDDERYATVSVNLSTGEATEIITNTGKQTKFNLL